MDRQAWWAIVHRVAKSWTWLKRLSMHTSTTCLESIITGYNTVEWTRHYRQEATFMECFLEVLMLLLCPVTKSCPTLCHRIDCSMPGFLVLHCLLEFAQAHVHWVGDAIQPSHILSRSFSYCLIRRADSLESPNINLQMHSPMVTKLGLGFVDWLGKQVYLQHI